MLQENDDSQGKRLSFCSSKLLDAFLNTVTMLKGVRPTLDVAEVYVCIKASCEHRRRKRGSSRHVAPKMSRLASPKFDAL